MSLVNLFTKEAPTIAGYSFDAILEDTFEMEVEITDYPIESGAKVANHRILKPFKWTMVGAISNNPLQLNVVDFAIGGLSNLTDNPLVSTIAGMSAGFLSGSDETRASSTLEFLIELTRRGEPFAINAGDITLQNMVITRLSRTKEPRNEGGLEFIAELQELITLDRVTSIAQPAQSELRDDDRSKSGLAGVVEKGQKIAKETVKAVQDKVNNVLDGVTDAVAKVIP